MKNQLTLLHLFTTLGILLFSLILFYFYLPHYFVNWTQPAVENVKTIGNTTFELLDYKSCTNQCTDVSSCENFYLFHVNSTNKKSIYQFLGDFAAQNRCPTWILFQSSRKINKNWNLAFYSILDTIIFPKESFAFSFVRTRSFSTTDLLNGQVSGKFKKYDNKGKLIVEQDVLNNVSEGKRNIYYKEYRVEQAWKNNVLITADTVILKTNQPY